jgi:negative regulator of flagellin synthesis FlgM
MKIGGRKPGVGREGAVKSAKKNSDDKAASIGETHAGVDAGDDNVELSTKAQTMKRLNSLIDSTPDIREAMVIRLRTDIENGSYSVNVEKVAERMLERAIKDSLYKER